MAQIRCSSYIAYFSYCSRKIEHDHLTCTVFLSRERACKTTAHLAPGKHTAHKKNGKRSKHRSLPRRGRKKKKLQRYSAIDPKFMCLGYTSPTSTSMEGAEVKISHGPKSQCSSTTGSMCTANANCISQKWPQTKRVGYPPNSPRRSNNGCCLGPLLARSLGTLLCRKVFVAGASAQREFSEDYPCLFIARETRRLPLSTAGRESDSPRNLDQSQCDRLDYPATATTGDGIKSTSVTLTRTVVAECKSQPVLFLPKNPRTFLFFLSARGGTKLFFISRTTPSLRVNPSGVSHETQCRCSATGSGKGGDKGQVARAGITGWRLLYVYLYKVVENTSKVVRTIIETLAFSTNPPTIINF